MALPSTDRFRRPTLQALSGGAPTTTEPVHDRVQAALQISDEDRAYIPPTSYTSTFTNRVAWAFVDLQRRGLIEKTRADPNTYKITEIGERALADGLDLSAISPRAKPPLDLPPAAGRAAADRSQPDARDAELPARSSLEPDPLPFGTRAFDPDRPPKPGDFRWVDLNQEAKHQLLEKARQGHHQILANLAWWLAVRDWTAIGEIPGSVDLLATSPGSRRWLFEAKTIRDGNQLSQTRGALAQLLEYRVTHGTDEDGLCIALDRSLPSERSDLLGRLGVAVIQVRDLAVDCLNDLAREITE
jgi:hypothetical protein